MTKTLRLFLQSAMPGLGAYLVLQGEMTPGSILLGQAVGVIGPPGAGKTTLAGVWPPAGGYVRLDGAALEHYGAEVPGQHIGYLPQRVQLFDGTIAENIARLSSQLDDAKVVEAARKAAAHEMILDLPKGRHRG